MQCVLVHSTQIYIYVGRKVPKFSADAFLGGLFLVGVYSSGVYIYISRGGGGGS